MSTTDMEKCVTYRRAGPVCTISCNLGLWSVQGPYGLKLIGEAEHYFNQYKADGEYSDILGGPDVLEVFKEQFKDFKPEKRERPMALLHHTKKMFKR